MTILLTTMTKPWPPRHDHLHLPSFPSHHYMLWMRTTTTTTRMATTTTQNEEEEKNSPRDVNDDVSWAVDTNTTYTPNTTTVAWKGRETRLRPAAPGCTFYFFFSFSFSLFDFIINNLDLWITVPRNKEKPKRRFIIRLFGSRYFFIFIMFSFLFYLFFRFNNKLLPPQRHAHATSGRWHQLPTDHDAGAWERIRGWWKEMSMRRRTRDVHPRLELPLFFSY